MRLDTPEGDKLEPSRRAIAKALFFVGYAPAVLASCASPVATSGDGLIEEDVRIVGAGGYPLPAYVARPSGGERRPAIVVVSEIFGIHDYIKDVCRRLAREGWVAIAPDYFDRAGDPAPLTDMQAIMEIVATASYEQQMGDTEGALRWLAQQSYVNAGLGITGFCWGGTIVWMACARFPQLKAGVAWYGRLVAPPTAPETATPPPRPWPVDIAGQLKAGVLGLYAQNDHAIPLDSVEAMRDALQEADNPKGSEIILYPGVSHGFHADYRESYNAEAAADGWNRMRSWFHRHGAI
jgi:carboxymethylenebutenolidase